MNRHWIPPIFRRLLHLLYLTGTMTNFAHVADVLRCVNRVRLEGALNTLRPSTHHAHDMSSEPY